jgi:hypothetical protein
MEKASNLNIHCSFGIHAIESVPFLTAVEKNAENHFTSPNSNNIYLLERAGSTVQSRALFTKIYSQLGSYLDAYIYLTSGIPIQNNQDMKNLREEFISMYMTPDAESTTPSLVNKVRLQIKIFDAYEYRMIDRLSTKRHFALASETYSDGDSKKLDTTHESQNSCFIDALEALTNQDLETARSIYIKATGISLWSDILRHNSYLDRLRNYAKQAQRQKNPTNVFIRIGYNHDILLKQIKEDRNRYLQQSNLSFSYDDGERTVGFHGDLIKKIAFNSGEKPSQDDYDKGLIDLFFTEILFNIMPNAERFSSINKLFNSLTHQELIASAMELAKMPKEKQLTGFNQLLV